KSTLGKDLAKALGYVFIDSGAMYRGVALFALENQWVAGNVVDAGAITAKLSEIQLQFSADSGQHLLLNGRDVSREIRESQVSEIVSSVAAIGAVREKLVELQRAMGMNGGIVMDGRDIGTVVFPQAELKLFITAALEIRSERRFLEMQKNNAQTTLQEVRDNLSLRDAFDTQRAISPLKQAADAVVIDTGNIGREEQLQQALTLVESIVGHEV
ncbi:MAG: (d)CMP kinase, partial [Flavobacteriia bacterium]|nr:(d)CMP kinase [Flavobacteriia bacterium]